VDQGLGDEVVAQVLGAKGADGLTPVQEKYRDKVKQQLAKVSN